mmetsp:Transcript_13027/g.21087  ORF Transcript_13027/g.21087 Transcript_13027/m.21087 type:complete len:363 (-) Transcript_13027:160-1248(-)|eukprot:CAMPEP_0203762576 /NCGR_PEP_ID=MMETSP0098-20131031/15428_1 /ASSEMBLY_ACC=CAM_ASM_000208 /TAXON_ID=96639 /ORGANISM=" , Strain NY0313808BC1" /LENGTH=362 /DNA_ID=CAMNT_0050657037 /DNA_START=390 /DNA_END=1478 /DNA_ORIENTATION=+
MDAEGSQGNGTKVRRWDLEERKSDGLGKWFFNQRVGCILTAMLLFGMFFMGTIEVEQLTESGIYLRRSIGWTGVENIDLPNTSRLSHTEYSVGQNNIETSKQSIVQNNSSAGSACGFSASSNVTVTLSSCSREPLLRRTLETFFKYNSFPIRNFIVVNDCKNNTFMQVMKKQYGECVEFHESDVPNNVARERRIMHNVAKLHQLVNTTYLFHLEDDWEFYAPGFIEKTVTLLDTQPNLVVALVIDYTKTSVKQNKTFGWKTVNGIKYGVFNRPAGPGGMFGAYSFNPGLRRTADVQKYSIDFVKLGYEGRLSKYLGKTFGLQMSFLEKGYTVHTGGNWHITDKRRKRKTKLRKKLRSKRKAK